MSIIEKIAETVFATMVVIGVVGIIYVVSLAFEQLWPVAPDTSGMPPSGHIERVRFELAAQEMCGTNATWLDLGDNTIRCVNKHGKASKTTGDIK